MRLAGALVRTSDTRVWLAAGGLVSSVIVAYVLSRTTGIPQDGGDIGDWGQPLGIAMLFVGGSLLALTANVLAGRLIGAAKRPAALAWEPIVTPRGRPPAGGCLAAADQIRVPVPSTFRARSARPARGPACRSSPGRVPRPRRRSACCRR